MNPELHIVNSRTELLNLLNKINDELQPGQFPLIHIEAHGLDQKNGIVLVSDDEVLWSELRPVFTEINIKCCNNLSLAISACSSSRIIDELIASFTDSIDSRAPFFCFIGTEEVIDVDYLIVAFPIFYQSLAKDKNWNKAVEEMNAHSPTKFNCDICYHVLWHWLHEVANSWIKERTSKILADPDIIANVYCKWYIYAYDKDCTIDAIMEIFTREQFYIDFFNKRLEDYLIVSDCKELNANRFPSVKSLPNFEKSIPPMRVVRRN